MNRDMIYFRENNRDDTALQQLSTLVQIFRNKKYQYSSEEEKKKMEDWLIEELKNKVQDLKKPATEYDRWVVIDDLGDGIFCCGIYKDYLTALGRVMDAIHEFHANYEDDGDEFSYTDPWETEGDGGYGITVTFKAKSWEKARTENYYILEAREHKEGGFW